jgi:hypothetical protein
MTSDHTRIAIERRAEYECADRGDAHKEHEQVESGTRSLGGVAAGSGSGSGSECSKMKCGPLFRI